MSNLPRLRRWALVMGIANALATIILEIHILYFSGLLWLHGMVILNVGMIALCYFAWTTITPKNDDNDS